MLKLHYEIIKEFKPIGRKKGKVILFDSLIKSSYQLNSDIDIAIVMDEKNVVEEAEKIVDEVKLFL